MTAENTNLGPPPEGSTPERAKTTQTPFDYYALLQETEQRGKKIYGDQYEIRDMDRAAILKLLCYFLQDAAAAETEGIDLNKGIMLRGPIGCGKTSAMNIMRSFCLEAFKPIITPCREICLNFSQKGYEVITHFGRQSFYPYTNLPRIYCFDDLGLESQVSYWGNNCNVMGEILLSRYDLFISHKMITHVTTNLNSEELEQAYGNRIRSRMREMFNVISFDLKSLDKRI